MTNKPNLAELRIIAITVDHKRVTLYDEQGETFTLQQGDIRIPPIIENALPLVKQHKVAIISLVPPEQTHYKDIEENSSGLVKLFRVAKSKLKSLFSDKTQDNLVTVKNGGDAPILTPEEATQHDPVAEVMKHATPTSDPNFHKPNGVITGYDKADTHDQTTICAMVDGVIIPGIENLERYLERASKMGSYEGILAFLKRIAAVINERSHSIEDLLRFLERADLPIADDGSIIIYKVLRKKREATGYYVDCHTGRVTQRVGSYVCMAPELVDPDRRNECSNGLHVARRGYINGFSGDVCVVAKLNPEDVIAVPNYDANKMRVCGYHILEELTSDMYQQLKLNKPMTDLESGKKMLGRILAGKHIGKIERVTIRGQKGQDVLIEQLDSEGNVALEDDVVYSAEALPEPGEVEIAPPVDFHEINAAKEADTPTEKQPVNDTMELTYNDAMRKSRSAATRSERILALKMAFNTACTHTDKTVAARAIHKEKVKAKISYEKLGIDQTTLAPYLDLPKKEKNKETIKSASVKAKAKPSPHKGTKVAYSAMTNTEKAADLWLDFQTAPDQASRTQAAIALSNFKREKKVSWEKLGLDKDEVEKKIKHLL